MTNRTIDITELQNATQSISSKRHVALSDPLAESLARKVAELLEQKVEFGEAMRFALNKLCVRDITERRLYSSVMGTYFGKHGGYKAAANKVAGKPPKPKVRKDVRKERGKSGQLAWKM